MSSVIYDTPVLAERYDKISNNQFEHGKLLVRELNIRAGDRVLDVGCGTGRLAEYISGIIGSKGRVCGIDPAEHRIKVARQKIKGKANVSFGVGRGENLSGFADNSFDTVVMNLTFNWIDDKSTTLTEVYRVLKPGGLAGIATTSRGLPGPLKAVTDELLKREPYASQVGTDAIPNKSVNADELLKLLADAGFTDIELKLRRTAVCYGSPADLVEFIEAFSFGNYLTHVPAHLRDAYMAEYIVELEKRQTARGIESVWNMLYAIARKPA